MIQGMDLLTFTIEVFPMRQPSQTCTPFIARELTLGIDMQTSSHPRSIIQSTSQEFGKIGVKQNKQMVRSSHIQMMYIFTRSFSRPSLDKTQNKTTTHALTLDTHALGRHEFRLIVRLDQLIDQKQPSYSLQQTITPNHSNDIQTLQTSGVNSHFYTK